MVPASRRFHSGQGGGDPVPRVEASLPDDIRKRVWQYVASGGRLIVAGDPETNPTAEENVLNALLRPTAMSFRDDTVNSLTQRWEDNLQSAPHSATASGDPGRSHFSLDSAASIRVAWPAGPLLVGRWAWDELGTNPDRPEALPYSPGNHLGDLVVAAQQNVGRGTVVVLGTSACLNNDGIPFSYTFTGPLLSALAADHGYMVPDPAPLAWWRQLAGRCRRGYRHSVSRFEPLDVVPAACALAGTMIISTLLNDVPAEVLPSGIKTAARPIIYVNGSHLEAMGKDPWDENGIGRLMRVLAHNGYLPVVAPESRPSG